MYIVYYNLSCPPLSLSFFLSLSLSLPFSSFLSLLHHSTIIFGPIAGGALLLTVLPIVFSTVMAYCVTGYIRDELFSSVVKKFIGKCCSFFVSFKKHNTLQVQWNLHYTGHLGTMSFIE